MVSNSSVLFRDGLSETHQRFSFPYPFEWYYIAWRTGDEIRFEKDWRTKECRFSGTDRALYLMDVINAITNRGNNAEVRRKKDGTLTVYEVKKNIVTV